MYSFNSPIAPVCRSVCEPMMGKCSLFLRSLQLRGVAVALVTNGGNNSALKGDDLAVFSSLPSAFQQDLVERFKAPGNFASKAAAFPIMDCLAAMVRDKF